MADLREDSVEVKPSIIMKVDAPPEDNNTITSQGGSMNSVAENDTARTSSKAKKSVLAMPRLNSNNSFLMRSSVLSSPKLNSGIVLRPSQLGPKLETKSENNKNPFALNPSRLNPLAKPDLAEDTNSSNNSTEKTTSGSKSSESNNGTSIDTPKFVPLATEPSARAGTSSLTTATTTTVSAPNFIFGQNLHERVVSESETAGLEPVASTSCTNANGTSELLFSSAAKKAAPAEPNKEVKSLTESAREYEESRANKRKYEEVAVVTGEEDEKNVLQINCKLFAFDKATGNWQERGRGTLRLNDKEVFAENSATFTQSRLVIRTTGSLRVVLNTKVWAEMTVDRASPKSLRLTAMDSSGQIKVFLIMANPEEINQLYRLLDARVQSEVERQKQLKSAKSEPDSKKRATETSVVE